MEKTVFANKLVFNNTQTKSTQPIQVCIVPSASVINMPRLSYINRLSRTKAFASEQGLYFCKYIYFYLWTLKYMVKKCVTSNNWPNNPINTYRCPLYLQKIKDLACNLKT